MKLGKRPAIYSPRTLRMRDFLPATTLPSGYGFDAVVGKYDWDMLGNDTVGDCVIAGGGHEHMLWTGAKLLDQPTPVVKRFSDSGVLADYSAITGYDPRDPNTDQGTNVLDAMRYRKATGLRDAAGNRRLISAYMALEPGNPDELKQAVYTFGAVGIGIEFPQSAMDQFNEGLPWSVVSGSPIEGGHYVPVVGYRLGYFELLTWGRRIRMSEAFFKKYNDEGYAMLAPDFLRGAVSVRGLDNVALQAALAAL